MFCVLWIRQRWPHVSSHERCLIPVVSLRHHLFLYQLAVDYYYSVVALF